MKSASALQSLPPSPPLPPSHRRRRRGGHHLLCLVRCDVTRLARCNRAADSQPNPGLLRRPRPLTWWPRHTRRRKREAREVHERSKIAKTTIGIKAKLLNKKRHSEKIQMKKTIALHEEKKSKKKEAKPVPDGAIPAYLMDRQGESRAKVLNNMIKQKRKEKAGKWAVPLPKVRAMDEMEVTLRTRRVLAGKSCQLRGEYASSRSALGPYR